jgi:protein-ribulosamine 3-kinase
LIADLIAVLGAAVTARTGSPFLSTALKSLGGGNISETFVLEAADGARVFVKKNQSSRREMFAAEMDGLLALSACPALRVPQPLGVVEHGQHVFLLLEFLEMGGRADGRTLGRAIAALHSIDAPAFGWHRDNTIGSTLQPNLQNNSWVDFFRSQRLAHQRRLLQKAGAPKRLLSAVASVENDMDAFFDAHQPRPSLLHGDLWSGNWSFTPDGVPALFDPAVYFGDHEADLAMMELFGNPGDDFFAEYSSLQPIDPGYRVRRDLYNLYHILNHALLFGGGYLGQAEVMARRLLRQ